MCINTCTRGAGTTGLRVEVVLQQPQQHCSIDRVQMAPRYAVVCPRTHVLTTRRIFVVSCNPEACLHRRTHLMYDCRLSDGTRSGAIAVNNHYSAAVTLVCQSFNATPYFRVVLHTLTVALSVSSSLLTVSVACALGALRKAQQRMLDDPRLYWYMDSTQSKGLHTRSNC